MLLISMIISLLFIDLYVKSYTFADSLLLIIILIELSSPVIKDLIITFYIFLDIWQAQAKTEHSASASRPTLPLPLPLPLLLLPLLLLVIVATRLPL